jgi:glycosyltransferase involved in cell wall biosynthesis
MINLAKRRDIPVVFLLNRPDASFFPMLTGVDYCVVPLERTRQRYWTTSRLCCHTLPFMVDWRRYSVEARDMQHVVILGGSLDSGASVATQIADELSRVRPDIPCRIVAGTNQAVGDIPGGQHLGSLASDRREITDNGLVDEDVIKPLLTRTKILILPWLRCDGFDMTAAAAMSNGIPLVVSSRGLLPDFVEDSRFVVDIPPWCIGTEGFEMHARDVQPWLDAIAALWDDPHLYQRQSEVSKRLVSSWQGASVAGLYREFFQNVQCQPGPPFVPQCE